MAVPARASALTSILAILAGLGVPSASAQEGAQRERAPASRSAPSRPAQSQPAPQQAPRTPAAQPAQPPAPAPAQAQEAAGQQAPPTPQRTEIIKHDNWTVTCSEFAENRQPRSCSAVLQVVQANSKQILFSWIISPGDGRKTMASFQTPTGIMVAPGIELKLGDGAARKIPFVSCEQGRCTASTVMDDGFLRDASAAETAQATIYGLNGQGVQFGIPLKGIDKAVAAVRR